MTLSNEDLLVDGNTNNQKTDSNAGNTDEVNVPEDNASNSAANNDAPNGSETDTDTEAEDFISDEDIKSEILSAGEQSDLLAGSDSSTDKFKGDPEKAFRSAKEAERKMHEATMKLAEFKKKMAELGYDVDDDGNIVPINKSSQEQEDETNISEEENYNDVDEYEEEEINPIVSDEETLNSVMKIIEGRDLYNKVITEKYNDWRGRPEYNEVKEDLIAAIQENEDLMPTQKDFIINPKKAIKKANRFFKIIDSLVFNNVQSEKVKNAISSQTREQVLKEIKENNISNSIMSGSNLKGSNFNLKNDNEDNLSYEDKVKRDILLAGRNHQSLF